MELTSSSAHRRFMTLKSDLIRIKRRLQLSIEENMQCYKLQTLILMQR